MRPTNLFDSSFEEIQSRGYKKITGKLEDGDLLQMSKDGKLWCKISGANLLRKELKLVGLVELWRQS